MMGARERLELRGCTPIPLANYLKGLAVLRLVAEQGGDPAARCWWENECLVLESALDEAAVLDFFARRYRPTPIVAPWNGGSGFFAGDNPSGIEPLRVARSPRLAGFSAVIAQADRVLAECKLTSKPEGEQKSALLLKLRAVWPDEALEWLDAAVVLAAEQPRYPPLLGTGGNDGRLDFTNNFMQRLVQLIDVQSGEPRADSLSWLRSALFGEAVPGLARKSAIGQFAPGAAGGPNAATGFAGDSLINPWDFVLMLEGALLFAAAASRRLEGSMTGLAYPFTVKPTGAGSGSAALADESAARAEMWMPLWRRAATLVELKALLGEGRATLGTRVARDGLDFARAVARDGVDRGIGAFQRYAFLMRSGKAYLATPLNRFQVAHGPFAELIDQLDRDRWLARFREAGRRGPHVTQLLVSRLEDALFEMLRDPRPDGAAGARRLQKTLIVLGAIQRHLAGSRKMRHDLPPVPRLSSDWVRHGDDASSEFRLAAALAGLSSEPLPRDAYPLAQGAAGSLGMAPHMAPVQPRHPARWFEGSSLVAWSDADLLDNLFFVLQRRQIEAHRLGLSDKPLMGGPCADLPAVDDLMRGAVDEGLINDLLPGLALCEPPPSLASRGLASRPLPLSYLLLKLLFVENARLRELGVLRQNGRLPLPSAIPRLLRAGRVSEALREGVRRRRAAGIYTPLVPTGGFSVNGRRLLAALLVPIGAADAARLFGKTEGLRRVSGAGGSGLNWG